MAQELSSQVVKGVQGIGYVCAFLLSLVICVPMSMHQDQFKGRCLLFSTGLWQEKDGQFKVCIRGVIISILCIMVGDNSLRLLKT